MSWNFWKKPAEVPKFDQPTDEYFTGDMKLIWQHQISGEKNFEYFNFLGTLNDLSSDADWPAVFEDIPNSDLFIKRLDEFFELNKGGLDVGEGKTYLYFSPRRASADEKTLLNAAENFLKLAIKIAEKTNDLELKDTLKKLVVEPVTNKTDKIRHHDNLYQEFDGIGGDNFSLYETWGDVYSENRIAGWNNIHDCLHEACYGLAADYYLVYWLMQDFHTVDIDTQAFFDFIWRLNGSFYREGNTIYVYRANKK